MRCRSYVAREVFPLIHSITDQPALEEGVVSADEVGA